MKLPDRYDNSKVQPTNSSAFSIAMDGTEARLFALQRPEHVLEFRNYVHNIKGECLNQIQVLSDSIFGDGERAAILLATLVNQNRRTTSTLRRPGTDTSGYEHG
ncbi:uncharacterized protein L3040_003236 [Drepanopeziza brunnea f. sp. 'multigermtubi']|nr:hypothetical protein L3040_003236 [Drepanopeziza brunnea f. sp. 'multigermtubi']